MTRLSRPPMPFVGIAAEDETVIRMVAADVLTEAGLSSLEAEHSEKAEVSGSRMQICVGYDLTFDCPQPLPMIVHLNVHYSRASHLVRPDHLLTVPTVPVSSYRDSFGNWVTRLVAPAGGIRVTTDALVLDSGLPDPVFPDLRQHPVQALPSETLLYLVPRCFGWVATWLCGQLQVEFPGEEVDDGFEVSDRAIASCLGLGGLDQTVDALDEIPDRQADRDDEQHRDDDGSGRRPAQAAGLRGAGIRHHRVFVRHRHDMLLKPVSELGGCEFRPFCNPLYYMSQLDFLMSAAHAYHQATSDAE